MVSKSRIIEPGFEQCLRDNNGHVRESRTVSRIYGSYDESTGVVSTVVEYNYRRSGDEHGAMCTSLEDFVSALGWARDEQRPGEVNGARPHAAR